MPSQFAEDYDFYKKGNGLEATVRKTLKHIKNHDLEALLDTKWVANHLTHVLEEYFNQYEYERG